MALENEIPGSAQPRHGGLVELSNGGSQARNFRVRLAAESRSPSSSPVSLARS